MDPSKLGFPGAIREVLGRPGAYRRALLLVFPPPGPMAKACLDAYAGDTVLYVGEGRGGCCADGAFFDALEPYGGAAKKRGSGWALSAVEDLAPFPGGHERLYIFKRTSAVGLTLPLVGAGLRGGAR